MSGKEANHDKQRTIRGMKIADEKPVLYIKPIAVRSNTVAQMLDISRPKVYELAAREDFHGAFKFGGCTLFSVEALEEWVRQQCAAGGANGQ